jgi:hypothetical protein
LKIPRMAAIFKMTADKIDKISMFSDFNENWYLGLFWSEELIDNDENCIQGHFYFQNGCQQNRQNFNVLWFQWKLISRVILKCQSIPHFKITLDINFHWNQRTLKFCRFCRWPFARDFLWSEYSTNPPSLREDYLLISIKKKNIIIIKFPNKVWELIVFAPFLIMKSTNKVLGISCFCTVSFYYYYYYY